MNHQRQGENIIFLVSQPRAGSTMLQLMLSGSTDIATTSEPWIALHPAFQLIGRGQDAIYDSWLSQRALTEFLKASGEDLQFYKQQTAAFLQSLYDKAIFYQNKKRFLDKTPRYYYILELLAEMFPAAKFIILFRNPLAVLDSIIETWVKDDLATLVDYLDDLILAPRRLLSFVKNTRTDRWLSVRYEDIVMETEEIVKKVCIFLDIRFEEQMCHYYGRFNSSWKFGDRNGISRSRVPTPQSIDKWKHNLTAPHRVYLLNSYLENLGPDLIRDMGYSYADLKRHLPLPSETLGSGRVPWDVLREVVDSFANIKAVRKAAFCALMEDRTNCGHIKTEKADSSMVPQMVRQIIAPKIGQMTDELNQMKIKISAMEATLSWRITAPLRDSELLKKLLVKFGKENR